MWGEDDAVYYKLILIYIFILLLMNVLSLKMHNQVQILVSV